MNLHSSTTTCCNALFLIGFAFLAGCEQDREDIPPNKAKYDFFEDEYDSAWNERNAEVYRFVLTQQIVFEPKDRIYFITITPRNNWGEAGDWETIPQVEMEQLGIDKLFHSASEAYLKDGHVLENGTDAEAWMTWVSVKQWVSDTKVIVEEGVWCCPLGGGASAFVYEKIDGKWVRTEDLGGWVS